MCESMSLIFSFLRWKQNYSLRTPYVRKCNLWLHNLCSQMENMISRPLKSFPGSSTTQVTPGTASCRWHSCKLSPKLPGQRATPHAMEVVGLEISFSFHTETKPKSSIGCLKWRSIKLSALRQKSLFNFLLPQC